MGLAQYIYRITFFYYIYASNNVKKCVFSFAGAKTSRSHSRSVTPSPSPGGREQQSVAHRALMVGLVTNAEPRKIKARFGKYNILSCISL